MTQLKEGKFLGRRITILIVLSSWTFLFFYCSGYLAVRSLHLITHSSNYRHWIVEKRSPEHYVGSDSGVINVFFKPLRLLEQSYHNRTNK